MNWQEEIEFLFKTQKLKWAYIYDQKGNTVAKFDDAKNVQEVKKNVLDFLNFWTPQRFKVIFKDNTGAKEDQQYTYYFDTREHKENAPIVDIPNMNGLNDSQIEDRIKNGIVQGLEALELKTKISEVENKEKTLDSTAGQIAIVIEKLVTVFAPQFTQQIVPIQGNNIEVMDEITDKELIQAFNLLVKNLGKESVLLVCTKVNENPAKFKQYLNFL